MPSYELSRAALAAAAARGAEILAPLRLLLTAEALTAPPPTHAIDLNADLKALCTAAQEVVVRRRGWLYFCEAECSMPALLPRELLQSAVLTFLRGVLRSGSTSGCVIRLQALPGAAVLTLQSQSAISLSGDLPSLLQRCAALCGGVVLALDTPERCARLLRVPLTSGGPLRQSIDAEDYQFDRYSAPRVYLAGYCAEDVP